MGRGAVRPNIRRNSRGGAGGGVSNFRLQTLNISPFRYEPLPNISSIYNRQVERQQFYENLGGEIGLALQRINGALAPEPTPVPRDLSATASFEETRQQFAELMEVLSEVALDSDALSRGLAVMRINQLLELNEDALIRMASSRGSSLEGIIVRREFVVAVLGRAPASASSLEGAEDRRRAYMSTNIRVPSPVLLRSYEIQQMLDALACMDSGRADAASGQ